MGIIITLVLAIYVPNARKNMPLARVNFRVFYAREITGNLFKMIAIAVMGIMKIQNPKIVFSALYSMLCVKMKKKG